MKRIVACFVCLCFCCVPALAHSGGTDSQGGHHDYKNVSGLGSYHYHHGMGPHLHPGGVCPYSSSGSSSSSGTSSSSSSSAPASWEETLIGWGFEFDRDMGIWKGWDGFYTEDRDYYLWDDCEYCEYCEWPSSAIGHPISCPYSEFYEPPEDAPGYCYDCENIIEDEFADHSEDCPNNPLVLEAEVNPEQLEPEIKVQEDAELSTSLLDRADDFIHENSLDSFALLAILALCGWIVHKLSKKNEK